MQRTSIDIAIVNYRGAADTLQALARLAHWPNGTVWLVDNSAHEADMAADAAALQQTVMSLREAQRRGNPGSADRPCAKLLTPGSNLGFGRACNLAFAESSSDFFLLLNPDARISNENVLALAEALTKQPRLGAVSPKIYWNEQHSFVLPAAFAQTPWYHVAQALATHSRRMAQWAALQGIVRAMRQMAGAEMVDVRFLAGSVLLLRRTAVLRAGGLFDPDYFMFYEDSDLSLRLRRAGYRLALVPGACAVHEYRHKAFKGELMAQSQRQYFSKQYPLFYRLSGQLKRVPRLARPVLLGDWFKVLKQPITSAEEFATQTGGAGVLALSPTMLMMPAMFRPSMADARCLDDREWALLEPASYVALLQGPNGNSGWTWVYFERAALCDHSPADTGLDHGGHGKK